MSDRQDLEIYEPKRPKDLGMSGACTRRFLNGICSIPGISYLEVGLASGSTFCAATAKNTAKTNQFIGIEAWNPDHFRSGEDMKSKFYNNFKRYVGNELSDLHTRPCGELLR